MNDEPFEYKQKISNYSNDELYFHLKYPLVDKEKSMQNEVLLRLHLKLDKLLEQKAPKDRSDKADKIDKALTDGKEKQTIKECIKEVDAKW